MPLAMELQSMDVRSASLVLYCKLGHFVDECPVAAWIVVSMEMKSAVRPVVLQ